MADKRRAAPEGSQLHDFVIKLEKHLQKSGYHGDLTGAGRYEALRVAGNGKQTFDDAKAAFARGMNAKVGQFEKMSSPDAQVAITQDAVDRIPPEIMAKLVSLDGYANARKEMAIDMSPDRTDRNTEKERRDRAMFGERDAKYWNTASRGEHTESPLKQVTDEELKNAALTTASLASLPFLFAAPAAIGGGVIARGLTGAAIGKASDYPIDHLLERMVGPGEESNPYLSAGIGAGIGMATAPASIKAMARGADALMTAGARGLEHTNDALGVMPYRSFMPSESASWAFPGSQNFGVKPNAAKSHRSFLTGDMHRQAMEGEVATSPFSLRGQGGWRGDTGEFEANDLFVDEVTSRGGLNDISKRIEMAERLNARKRQEAIAPYDVRPSFTERGANATSFPAPSRDMIAQLSEEFGGDAVLRHNPFLNSLFVGGFENNKADPEILRAISERLGNPGAGARLYGNYVTQKSPGIPRIVDGSMPNWLE